MPVVSPDTSVAEITKTRRQDQREKAKHPQREYGHGTASDMCWKQEKRKDYKRQLACCVRRKLVELYPEGGTDAEYGTKSGPVRNVQAGMAARAASVTLMSVSLKNEMEIEAASARPICLLGYRIPLASCCHF